jgi:CheY-like chemotaxis protein
MMASSASSKAEGPEPESAEPGDKHGLAVDRVKGPTILLIEDDFMLRGSLATVLTSEGYHVECAANALDALRRLDRPPKPALILLDIMLPYMDGLEFRALQRRMPSVSDVPVIVITAVGIKREIAEDLDLRQTFFKPLDRPRLLDAIKRHCPQNVS